MNSLGRARAIQLRMLPDPPKLPELDIAVLYKPCDEVGGDFYDFIPINADELGILIADVSGHGVEAALIMSAAKKALHIHARGCSSPKKALSLAAMELGNDLPTNAFITCFYGVLDLRSLSMTYACAGHNPVLLCSGPGSEHPRGLGGKGTVINGVLSSRFTETLEEQVVQLETDDTLLFHTDGLTECRSEDGDEFGEHRLEALFSGLRERPVNELVKQIDTRLGNFGGGRVREDDVTVIALRLKSVASIRAGTCRTNFELPTSGFFGRGNELKLLRDSVSSGKPCVVIQGPVGVGKSRLALEASSSMRELFPGGMWRVSVEGCKDQTGLLRRLAEVLRAQATEGAPLREAVAAVFAARPASLLILDQDDRLIDGVHGAVDELLRSAPGLTVWITSQTNYSFEDKVVVRLEGLSDLDAAELLRDRCSPDIGLDERAVRALARGLSGNPLAIELAVPRLRAASADTYLSELEASHEPGAGPAEGAMQDFVEECSPGELAALAAMCAFPDPLPSDVLLAVLAAVDLPEGPSEYLMRLHESRVVESRNSAFGMCYSLVGQLRRKAAPAIPAASRAVGAAAGVLAAMAQTWRRRLDTAADLEASEWFNAQRGNLLAAVNHIERTNTRNVRELVRALYCDAALHNRAHAIDAEQLPLLDGDGASRCLVLLIKARIELEAGRWAECVKLANAAMKEADGLPLIAAQALLISGTAASRLGRSALACRRLTGASRRFHARRDDKGKAAVLLALARDSRQRGENGECLRYAERAIDCARNCGAAVSGLRALVLKAWALNEVGRTHEALRCIRQVREGVARLGSVVRESEMLLLEAAAAFTSGNIARAAGLFETASRADAEDGGSSVRFDAALGLARCAEAAGDLDAALVSTDSALAFAQRMRNPRRGSEALVCRGMILLRRHGPKEAIGCFEQAADQLCVESEWDAGSDLAVAVAWQSLCMLRMKRYDEAARRADYAARRAGTDSRNAVLATLFARSVLAVAERMSRTGHRAAQTAAQAHSLARRHEISPVDHAPPHVHEAFRLIAQCGTPG